MVEVEILAAVSEVLSTLGFTAIEIQLNHRQLLTALLEASGVDGSLHTTALVAIDKLDKIGRDKVRDEMVARGLSLESADTCLDAFENPDAFERLVSTSEYGSKARHNIASII